MFFCPRGGVSACGAGILLAWRPTRAGKPALQTETLPALGRDGAARDRILRFSCLAAISVGESALHRPMQSDPSKDVTPRLNAVVAHLLEQSRKVPD